MELPIGTGLNGSITNLISHIRITTIPIKTMTTMMILIGKIMIMKITLIRAIILSQNPNLETHPKIIIILTPILPRLINNRHRRHPLHQGNNTHMLIKMAHESSHTISLKEE